MSAEFEVRMNLPAFGAQLKALKEDFQKRAVRSATGAAASVIAEIARKNAPVSKDKKIRKKATGPSGTLKKAIYQSRGRKQIAGAYRHVIGVRSGKKYKSDGYYWRWVEAGHFARGRGQKIKGGNRTRALKRERLRASGAPFVPGQWFLRNSLREGQGKAINAFSDRLTKKIKEYERGI